MTPGRALTSSSISQWEYIHTIVSKSLLLQAWLKAMEKEKGPQQPPAPVFNVILPDNAYGHFQPALHDPFVPAPLAVHALLPPMGLISGTYSEGMKMDITTFCHIFVLPDVVLQRFQEHAISGMLSDMDYVLSKVSKNPPQ